MRDVGDNSAQDPFYDELRTLEPDSPQTDMPSFVASSSTTSNTYGEAPAWAAIPKGSDGLPQRVDNNALGLSEGI